MRILLSILTALCLMLAGATVADAHGRGATARPLIPMESVSGLRLSGVVTCSTITARAVHPDGRRALLQIVDVTTVTEAGGVLLESVVDYETSMMSWVDVIPGHLVSVSVAGAEDGDSLREIVTVPACVARGHR